MGHDLYRMIRYGAPPGWTTPMRLVAGVIADDARDPRQGAPEDGGWPWSTISIRGYFDGGGEWHDGLTEQTGLSERAVRHALEDLGKADYEMRERTGTDRRGRPVFAYRGHAMRFRVPLLAPRKPPERRPDTATITGERPPGTATERQGKGGRIRSQRRPNTAGKAAEYGHPVSPDPPIVPPAPVDLSSPSSVEGARTREPTKTNDHDQHSGGTGRPASRKRQAPPDLAYTIVRRLPREVGAGLHPIVTAMLTEGAGQQPIEAALTAWQASGKPPEALPEFVEPPS